MQNPTWRALVCIALLSACSPDEQASFEISQPQGERISLEILDGRALELLGALQDGEDAELSEAIAQLVVDFSQVTGVDQPRYSKLIEGGSAEAVAPTGNQLRDEAADFALRIHEAITAWNLLEEAESSWANESGITGAEDFLERYALFESVQSRDPQLAGGRIAGLNRRWATSAYVFEHPDGGKLLVENPRLFFVDSLPTREESLAPPAEWLEGRSHGERIVFSAGRLASAEVIGSSPQPTDAGSEAETARKKDTIEALTLLPFMPKGGKDSVSGEPSGEVERAALLIGGAVGGDHHPLRYANNIILVYSALVNRLGYRVEDVYTFYKFGADREGVLAAHVPPSNRKSSDIAEIESTLKTLAERAMELRSQGRRLDVFVYMTGHGGGFLSGYRGRDANLRNKRRFGVVNGERDLPWPEGDEIDVGVRARDMRFKNALGWARKIGVDEVFRLQNAPQTLTDDKLARTVESFPGGLVFLIDPCFSGGYVWDLRGSERLTVASSSEMDYAFSTDDRMYSLFTFLFVCGLCGDWPDHYRSARAEPRVLSDRAAQDLTGEIVRALPGSGVTSGGQPTWGFGSIAGAFEFAQHYCRFRQAPIIDLDGDGIGFGTAFGKGEGPFPKASIGNAPAIR